MPNNKWDDDHIENLLKDFPNIKDERPKEEVYNRLQKAQKPKNKFKHWLPYFVAALAFLTFGVLLASMLGQNSNDSAFEMSDTESGEDEASVAESTEESVDESAEESSTAVEDGPAAEAESAPGESDETAAEESSESFNSLGDISSQAELAIYEEQLDGFSLFTIGLTENGVVIPVSFLIGHDRLLEDFGSIDVEPVDLYNQYAAEIDEEALGFNDYHPYSGSIEMVGEEVAHILPEDHGYDLASASMNVYFNSLSASFGDASEIAIVDEAGNPANFDQIGPISPLESDEKNIAYYSYNTANGNGYLAPAYDMPYENAVSALEAMKSSPNDLYTSIVPSGLDYTVSETEATVTVEFDDPINFDSYEDREARSLIAGMVLAADSFGKELMLTNTADSTWNGFDFSDPLTVPAGINVMEFNK